MLKRYLKDFELHINPATWNAAQTLLQAGRVKNLREVEKHFWVALVEDEETSYETEVMITPHKIKAFTCECFTEGRQLMCPHVAATLVKLRQFQEQRAEERRVKAATQPATETNRLTVQNVLENASLTELNDFVREYARRDRNFALALKTWFAGSMTEAENPYLLVLESVIPKSVQTKSYREPEFRRLRTTLDDLGNQYTTAISLQNFRTAYQIATAILLKAMPMLPKTEDNRRDQLLAYSQTNFRHLIQLQQEPLSPELLEGTWALVFDLGINNHFPPEMLREVLRFLSETAGDETRFATIRELFDQTPHPASAFVLHLFLAALAKRNMPQAVIRVLADYAEQPLLVKEGILQLYYLKFWDAVTETAEHFLQQKIFTPGQRRELEDILFIIAEKTDDHVRQIRLLRERFVLTGQFDFYNRLKIKSVDEWPAELEKLLADLKFKNDFKTVAAVLAEEGERVALAELLETSDDLLVLQRYEDLFLPDNKNFIRDRYSVLLSEYLREHFGRQASAQVRLYLAGLLNKGETTLVADIIRDLSAQFEERQTLGEELAELFPKSRRKAAFGI